MGKDEDDFRSYRFKQPSEAFVFGPPEGDDPNPDDLIDDVTWSMLTALPDDVSIRTSDNHGNELRIMSEFIPTIYNEIEEIDSFTSFLIDISLEFQGSLSNLFYGFYRVSASCLRNALELSLYGLYFQKLDTEKNAHIWTSGGYDDQKLFGHIQGLGNVCSQLDHHHEFKNFNFIIDKKLGFSLFNQKHTNIKKPGISRQLHSDLSKYVHSRPGYNLADFWNYYEYGPIYANEAFKKISQLYLDTFLLIYVFIKLGRPETHFDLVLYDEIIKSKLTHSPAIKIILESAYNEIK